MTMISYAQNCEDIMLWRVLRGVERGFYIDVGANDPVVHSVTHLFYEHGWRGINIEANRQYFERLKSERPGDVNICAVATNFTGSVNFFEIDGTGLSTTDECISKAHDEIGFKSSEVKAEALTLATICERHVRGEVHFLKIDVEGGTRAVLEGMDLAAVRPWIILSEAVRPFSQEEDFGDWEDALVSRGYTFVYADGLNRFYLADEHLGLRDRFKYPPNVFDEFSFHHGRDAVLAAREAERAGLQAKLAEQVQCVAEVADEAERLRTEKAALEATLADRTQGLAALEAQASALAGEREGLRLALVELTRAGEARAAEREAANMRLSAALEEQMTFAGAAEARTAQLEREVAALQAALAAQAQAAEAQSVQWEREKADLLVTRATEAQAAEERLVRLRHENVLLRSDLGAHVKAAEARRAKLEQETARLHAVLAAQAETTRQMQQRGDHLEAILQRVAASPSWRITAPLRALGKRKMPKDPS